MLKRYYSIEEAAEFLTSEHKQTITRMDVLTLARHGDVRLCTWFDGRIELGVCDNDPINPSADLEDTFSFIGYIQIPKDAITPSGGEVSFHPEDSIEIMFYKGPPIAGITFPWFLNQITSNCDNAVIPAQDLINLSQKKQDDAKFQADNPHKSSKLSMLNQASYEFWANADKNDSGTHPKNEQVAAWLEERGFTKTLAEKGATIIRPEWVPQGRKPEE
ncbi:hypothetical protein C8R27_1513 [Nitrosomonas ureae]|uniref:hypothetical protein n=1 Tax=Nitrosomonas ureae TaxID=44577 RepID=UPI000D979EBA|nr:hypothetical protein [Nitrosomonas ureae]PXX07516.1 hypothetical protein C8R27_1513 [Nitrosomonas ureae]